MSTEIQQEESEAEELSDQLLEVELKTVDTNHVRARVADIKDCDGTIKVRAEVPGGETVTERMPKPVPWSSEYKFARIVESKGYDAGTTHHLLDEEVIIQRTSDDEWEFTDPKGWRWYLENRRAGVVSAAVAFVVIGIGLVFAPQIVIAAALAIILLLFMALTATL